MNKRTWVFASLCVTSSVVLADNAPHDVQAGAALPTRAGQVVNISTRGKIDSANKMHGGFVITDGNKVLLLKGIGPSLADLGLSGLLPDPYLTLYRGQEVLDVNDNWLVFGGCDGSIGLEPAHANEPCIMATLPPGAYTAVLSGFDADQGKAIVSVNDIGGNGTLINLSTRGQVVPGEESLTGGFVIRDESKIVVVKGLGPTMADQGVPGTLADPLLTLYSGQQVIATNDSWPDGQCGGSGLEPNHDVEPCIMIELAPGAYTAIVKSADSRGGAAIVSINQSNCSSIPCQ